MRIRLGAPNESGPVVLATRNAHKLSEMRRLLAGVPDEILSLDDLGLPQLEEEGTIEVFSSFELNALAKARYYRRRTGLRTLADDSGLCVDALEGGPGVHSRRFAPDDRLTGLDQDEANNLHLLERLRDVPDERRTAYYRCVFALAGDRMTLVVGGRVDGLIGASPRGAGGFGYDPLFVVPMYGRTFGELPAEVKAALSHRAAAARALRRWLESAA